MVKQTQKHSFLDKISVQFTDWVGSTQSILVHTLFFIGIFLLSFLGVTVDKILLILTTAVSLEAIYLAIFIQMTVNRNTKSLEEVEADIDEIQEDVEDLEEDIDEIQEDETEDEKEFIETQKALSKIEGQLQVLLKEIDDLKKPRGI